MAAKSRAQAHDGKGREIAGICLLGLGVFSALSLVSAHAGSGRLMGPGGRAMATGLYSLAGLGAYLLVTALVVVAVRCFRGRPLQNGASEIFGVLGVLLASTVLLHLPYSGKAAMMRGPGGVLGQWLGQITASFIGDLGAGLAAGMLLAIALMVLTDVSVRQVSGAVGWVLAHAGRGVGAGARAVGRMVVAMFPERSERERARHDEVEEELPALDSQEEESEELEAAEDEAEDTLATPASQLPAIHGYERTIVGMPVAPVLESASAAESEAVVVGKGKAPAVEVQDEAAEEESAHEEDEPQDEAPLAAASELEAESRRALAAVVAEVAAVECAAPPAARAEAPIAGARGDDAAAPPVIVTPTDKRAADKLPTPGPRVEEPAPPLIIEPDALARPRAKLEPVEERPKNEGPGFIRLSEGDFKLPSADLLEYLPPPAQEIDKQGLYDMAARLEQAMSNYGVKGNVSAINMGPVVTMYEFAPAPGTRTGKIAQLENDLAMALEAQAVRIVAPIPGKAVVGVEVPNKSRQTVYLKEILVEECFRSSGSKLQIALGKDIKGNPVSVNLAKMPHLLVAGTTGSGKSVTVNGMITSLLYNASPEEVRFIMVDPKMLELSIYEGIPHLLLPVVTDPKKANLALRWAVDEMERRYELLSKTGVRDVSSYNAKIETELGKRAGIKEAAAAAAEEARRLKVVITGADGSEEEVELEGESSPAGVVGEELREEVSDRAAAVQAVAEGKEETPRKLPYIVIVIDEFADLMMVAPKDVETSVARIAQKARAAGLHLILATQRPSVDVITGLIKANFPSRIALQVASKIDSRTILDQPGAETLLGNGDMLFSDRGTKLRRIHGAFLSDDEVHRVVDSLKAQAKPVYDMDILKPRDDENEDGEAAPAEDFHDALYDQAVAIVCETRQASVSFIQRRLQIGYNRSARMVEQMERDGIVGPANGIKPREVIAQAGEYLTQAG